MYPSTLAEWDSLEPHAHSARAITAVNLARLTHTDTILPSALYSCTLLPNWVLLSGAVHSDGTIDILECDDLLRCMDAQTAGILATLIIEWFRPRSSCGTSGACEPIWLRLRNATMTHMKKTKQYAAVLGQWDKIFSDSPGDLSPLAPLALGLCDECVRATCEFLTYFRTYSWGSLPRKFHVHVEGWKEPVD